MELAFKRAGKLIGMAVAALTLAVVLGGCAQSVEQPTSAETSNANRNYMTQANQVIEELNTKLEAFDDAVSRDDVVSMRTQADGAFAALDKLDKLETPDDLKEVQEYYSDGCASLKEALSGYVDLYTEISSATDDQPFDYSTYDERLGAIQEAYNQGIEALKAGDQKASEL